MTGQSQPFVSLFSYGTLRQANVQQATFGRLLAGRPDALAGFALAPMAIADPHVIATSGAAVHTIARTTGDPADLIPGLVFSLTPAELEAADRYEAGPIRRVRVRLQSGVDALSTSARKPEAAVPGAPATHEEAPRREPERLSFTTGNRFTGSSRRP